MQYKVEDLSPVKKNIQVTVPADEVNASLDNTLQVYRTNVTMKGFRRGKAPLSMVEQRFRKEVHGEAASELVDKNIAEILKEAKLAPVSRISFDGGELERDKEMTYSLTFEVMPEFEFPAYEELEVEQEEAIVADSDIDAVLERFRGSRATPSPVSEDRLPRDSDMVKVDFEGFDEKGEAIPEIKGTNFSVTVGQSHVLPEFEEIIKKLKKGESGEGPVSFPADYFNQDFAGKTVTMKVKMTEIAERDLPALDDTFASEFAGFATLDEMKENIRKSFAATREDAAKADAKAKLLDKLMSSVPEFEVPEIMLEANLEGAVNNMKQQLSQLGGSMENMGGNDESFREEARPDALKRTREQIVLLTLARKNELSVSDSDAHVQIGRMARQSGQDFEQVLGYFRQGGMMEALKERLLEDKALDLVYDRAKVTLVPPSEKKEAEKPAKKETKPAAKKKAAPKKAKAADEPADGTSDE